MKAGDKLRFNIRLSQVPEYHPEPEPNPICTHSPDCQGCPYPRHGFLCWGADGSCLRSRVNEIANKEGTNVMNDTYLYPWGPKDARNRNEIALWRESYRANVACRQAIEDTIRQNFDGMHLSSGCLEPVLEEYGYKRTAWVLANTLHELKSDGRFSQSNKLWANRFYIPADPDHNSDFTVRSHPAVLDGFVDLYRKAYQDLGLFGPEHCTGDRSEQDFTGKVLVLSPDTLKESCWRQEDQLWYAHDGFGCSPHARGRSVRCTCLGDGEMTRWNRSDFVGVLKEEFLPDWALEKLDALRGQEQADAPAMGGMTMK